MKQRSKVIFAVLATFLVVSVAPASAVEVDGIAVGSKHTTASDFENGSLANMTIVGSGEDASVVHSSLGVVDDFEDGDLAEYQGDSSFYSTTTEAATHGSLGLRADIAADSTNYYLIESGDSLPDFEPGNTIVYNTTVTNASDLSAFIWAVQDTDNPLSGGSYRVELNANNNELYMSKGAGGTSNSSSVDLGSRLNASLQVRVEWEASGQMTATLYDASGYVTSVSIEDSEYASGGLGYRGYSYAGTSEITFDYVHGLGGGTSAIYTSASHYVTNAQKAQINITELSDAEAQIEVQAPADGGTWTAVNSTTISSAENVSLDISGSDEWRVRVNVSANGSSPRFVLSDESVLFVNHLPEAKNASPTSESGLNENTANLSVDVSDPQFGTAQGESVTVQFTFNGEVVANQTVTENGTVSTTVSPAPGTSNTWSVQLTDSYGGVTTTPTYSFDSPAQLKIYNETNPGTLVTEGVNLTVQFYPLGENGVVSRQAQDGVVNLTGLPVDERFVVTVTEDGTDKWAYRRIVIDSIYESSRIYLLNKSVPNSQVVFELQDPTGQFPPEETVLYVEKPISVNNTTDYQTIAGDTFGSTGRFPVVLQEDTRYRLRVATTDGQNERAIGSYSVYGEALEPLLIQRIQPNSDAKAGSTVYGSLEKRNGTSNVAVRFQDLGGDATNVTYRVEEGENGTVIVPNVTTDADSFAHLYPVNNSTSYTVRWWVDIGGETESGSFTVGDVPALGLPGDAQLLSIVSWIAILSTMGLLVIVNPGLAPVGGVGMASALVIIGTVAIPAPILGVSGAISVLALFGGRN